MASAIRSRLALVVALGRDAYVFTYPLVINYRAMYMRAIKGDARMSQSDTFQTGGFPDKGSSTHHESDCIKLRSGTTRFGYSRVYAIINR